MKQCNKCDEYKFESGFHKKNSAKDKLHPYCKVCVSSINKVYYLKNKQSCNCLSSAWRVMNRIRSRELNKYSKERHREHYADKEAKRRVAKRQATCSWGNTFFIKEIYALAALRTRVTGYKWEVDHIIPLKGTRVSGLHVENNLQVIPAIVNRKKHNTYIS